MTPTSTRLTYACQGGTVTRNGRPMTVEETMRAVTHDVARSLEALAEGDTVAARFFAGQCGQIGDAITEASRWLRAGASARWAA
jgi:hypothetical protein